jgi:hypothetical protein
MGARAGRQRSGGQGAAQVSAGAWGSWLSCGWACCKAWVVRWAAHPGGPSAPIGCCRAAGAGT